MASKSAFISHISAETELAQALKERLQQDFLGMLDIFVSSDRSTIQAGTRWLDEVDRALRDSDVQLVLCSEASVGRPWVNFEAGAAWIRGVPVIPVCHSGLTPDKLPVPLSMLESVECSTFGLQKLYDAIAAVLTVRTPGIDFRVAAADLQRVEKAQMEARGSSDYIENPRILCAASEQYAEPDLGFHLDVDVVRRTFGEDGLTIERALTRRRLTELLTEQQFDIIHLVLAVDQDTGDLIFSSVNLGTNKPTPGHVDRLSSAGFAELLRESETRLVVLATCKALLLAVDVAHVANMAASDDDVTGEAAAEWSESFYGLLRQGMPLFRAFEITRSQLTEVPIRAIRHRDLTFRWSGEK